MLNLAIQMNKLRGNVHQIYQNIYPDKSLQYYAPKDSELGQVVAHHFIYKNDKLFIPFRQI